MAIFQINCCGPKLGDQQWRPEKSIDSEIFTKYWIRERIDNGAHISGLGHSMNHRRGTDDENVEFEVPMEHRGGYVQHILNKWKQEAGVQERCDNIREYI